jgi:tRNA nucleotidyltransferase (CCA-adding enzyme)
MEKDGSGGWRLPSDISEQVLRSVSPDPSERRHIEEASIALIEAVERTASDMGLDSVRCILSGSVAKGTYMKDPDLDLFILFMPGTGLDVLKEKGLEIGRRVLSSPKLNYAQHPYMTGSFMGLRADIVPGIDIPEGARVVTAVDRTQHHTRYVNSRLVPKSRDDVILLKSFLKGIGSYGAEDTSTGFSGYLSELLVLWKGSFGSVVEWFASLPVARSPPTDREEIGVEHIRPGSIEPVSFAEAPLCMDPPHPLGDYRSRFERDILIIIDPTDRERNVASPVSAQTLAHTALCAASLIASPTTGCFHPYSGRPHDLSLLLSGSLEGAFVLDLPEGDPSRIASQLRRSFVNLSASLRREGFDEAAITFIYAFGRASRIDPAYKKSRAAWSGDIDSDSVIFWISTVPPTLPETYRHWGPPEDNRQAADFRARWKDRQVVSEEGRLFVDLRRTRTEPNGLALELWASLGHGPDISPLTLRRYGD